MVKNLLQQHVAQAEDCIPVCDVHVAPLIKSRNVSSVEPAISISPAHIKLHMSHNQG